MILIRTETPEEIAAVRVVEEKAFGRPAEADVVDRLRARGAVTLSLVAVDEGQVVGHVLFTPVDIVSQAADGQEHRSPAIGMGPVAVLPGRQKQGIGSRLIRAGLEEIRQGGHAAVVVLGDPRYYTRFGFVPASRYGIRFQDEAVPAEDFMVQELRRGVLEIFLTEHGKGTAVYQPEFQDC
jgi:putative acetyltransferase